MPIMYIYLKIAVKVFINKILEINVHYTFQRYAIQNSHENKRKKRVGLRRISCQWFRLFLILRYWTSMTQPANSPISPS